MKNSTTKDSTGTLKAPYEKPITEVYEMEMDASVLTDTESGLNGTEANLRGTENPFNDSFNNLKA